MRLFLKISAIAIMILCGLGAEAQEKRPVRFGIEWAFTPQLFESHTFYYVSSQGYAVNDKSHSFDFQPNGEFMGVVDFNVTDKFTMGCMSGIGSSAQTKYIPLILRLSWFTKGNNTNSFFWNFGAGAGFHLKSLPAQRTMFVTSFGGGYRTMLTETMSINFALSIRINVNHPALLDADTGTYIPAGDVRQNTQSWHGLSLSTFICF